MEKKICFLFGAGAEGENNFGLSTGIDFMKKSFLGNDIEIITSALKNSLDEKDPKYFGGQYTYTAHSLKTDAVFKSILKKWIFSQIQDENRYISYKYQIRSILNKEEFEELLETIYSNHPEEKIKKELSEVEKKTEIGNKIIEKFIKLLSVDEKELSQQFSELDNDKEFKLLTEFFEGNKYNKKFKKNLPTAISHILDSHFHTIINPQKFGKIKFSRIVNYYWTIFFALYNPILEIARNGSEEKYDSKYYLQQLNNLEANIKKLYSDEIWDTIEGRNRETYYHWIKEELSDSISGVITTNYFHFAEKIIGKPTAYINGQLKLFEIPEKLEVINITEESLPKDCLYFPFIFGQSYTKPIVSRYQIEAFNMMGEILDDSNILVILGYNLNEDDNHLNAYLHDFVSKNNDEGRKIIVVGNSESEKESVCKKLKLANGENLEICQVNYQIHSPYEVIGKLKKMIAKRT